MKILKPGKVEQRKFACPKCGCVFVANEVDFNSSDSAVKIKCPYDRRWIRWTDGEPYEEPVQSDMDRLITVLHKNWAMDDEFADSVAQTLIANGVTFREV